MAEALPAPSLAADQVESLITLNRALLAQQLLRGLAHDVRNNLQIMALGSSLDAETRGSAIARKIDRAFDDIVASLDLLSGLGRSPADEPPDSPLAEVIDEVAALADLQRNLPTARMTLVPPPTAMSVAIRRSDLIQILLNLVANAKEAQGRPTDGIVVSTTMAMEGSVAVLVDDSGTGMSVQAGAPFGSTRDRTQHGGIGLFCARMLLERAGGGLAWEARAEGGTRVRAVLPLSQRY